MRARGHDVAAVLGLEILSELRDDLLRRGRREEDALALHGLDRRGSKRRGDARHVWTLARDRGTDLLDLLAVVATGSSADAMITRSARDEPVRSEVAVHVVDSPARTDDQHVRVGVHRRDRRTRPLQHEQFLAERVGKRAPSGTLLKNVSPAMPPPQRRHPTVVTRLITASS